METIVNNAGDAQGVGTADEAVEVEVLVEDVSIDGMCGVY
ncbi:MAG TPA: mycofactocin precursor MftA [Kineosporiaceae bacterium]